MAKKPRVKWYGKKAEKVALEAAMKALMTGGEAILTEAINDTPLETGTLRRSGTVTRGGLPDAEQVFGSAQSGTGQKQGRKVGSEQAVYVSFNTPYALPVHEGVGPHKITVDTKKTLAVPIKKWKGHVNSYGSGQLPMLSKDGNFVILGRSVNHPGFSGYKYLENPFNRLKKTVFRYVDKQVKKALQKEG